MLLKNRIVVLWLMKRGESSKLMCSGNEWLESRAKSRVLHATDETSGHSFDVKLPLTRVRSSMQVVARDPRFTSGMEVSRMARSWKKSKVHC